MNKSMCITYFVEQSLYVNITNKCPNRCDFCIRNNADGAYGSDSLWLLREPTVNEIAESILSHDLDTVPELVFCGYGEPTCRLDDMLASIDLVRAKYPKIKIRLNTNGQSDLINGYDTASKFHGKFDVISISLNSSTPEGYDRVCHSRFGPRAHDALISFAENVKNYVPTVVFSVVGDFLTDEDIKGCRAISERTGVTLRIRDYIPPAS